MALLKTRQALVDAARRQFAKKGYDNVTMNDIALDSGKGRRTLYLYFKDKHAIYEAVIDAELLRLSSQFLETARLPLNPEEKLVELLLRHLYLMKVVVARNGHLRAEFFRNIWQVEHVRKRYDVVEHEIFEHVLRMGCEEGCFEISHIRLMADVIQASVRGMEVPYIYGRLCEGMTENERRTFVRTLVHRALGVRK